MIDKYMRLVELLQGALVPAEVAGPQGRGERTQFFQLGRRQFFDGHAMARQLRTCLQCLAACYILGGVLIAFIRVSRSAKTPQVTK